MNKRKKKESSHLIGLIFMTLFTISGIESKQNIVLVLLSSLITLFLLVLFLNYLGIFDIITNSNKKRRKKVRISTPEVEPLKKEVLKSEPVKQEEPIKIKKEYSLPNQEEVLSKDSKSLLPFLNAFKEQKELMIPIGTNDNEIIYEKIKDMPNMFISGTVMSGKTTYVNMLLSSILLTKKDSQVKLILFDSRKVEYKNYNGIPHLLAPVLYDTKKLSETLKKVVQEIKRRMTILEEASQKNIETYNNNVCDEKKIPDIVIIIDDYSSIISMDDINHSLEFITKNGWYVNTYVILVTNYPSTKVIPTLSQINFPARLCFKVISSRISQLVLDNSGAEKLNAFGEALYRSRKHSNLIKVKTPFIKEEDINKIIAHYHSQEIVNDYDFVKEDYSSSEEEYDDPMYNEVVEFAISTGKISAPLIQRRFRFGYNRAARLIDLMEERGIIGPQNGSRPREVLVNIVKTR